MLDSTLEELTVDRVTIAKQEASSLIEWERFNDLLRGPLRGRMSGDVEVNDMSSIMSERPAEPLLTRALSWRAC